MNIKGTEKLLVRCFLIVPYIIGFLVAMIIIIKNIINSIAKKSCKTKKQKFKLFEGIIVFIIISVLQVFFVFECYNIITDYISGPKEVVVDYAKVYKKTGYTRYRITDGYLAFVTTDNLNKKIAINGEQNVENITNIINENDKVKIYYFEKLNEVYYVEKYE